MRSLRQQLQERFSQANGELLHHLTDGDTEALKGEGRQTNFMNRDAKVLNKTLAHQTQ